MIQEISICTIILIRSNNILVITVHSTHCSPALLLHCTTPSDTSFTINFTLFHFTSCLVFILLNFLQLHCTSHHHTSLHYTTLHFTSLYFTTLRYTSLHNPQDGRIRFFQVMSEFLTVLFDTKRCNSANKKQQFGEFCGFSLQNRKAKSGKSATLKAQKQISFKKPVCLLMLRDVTFKKIIS
jgi:hypothetical protein